MRICLGVSYNGNRFHGWQRQDGLRTVQQELEEALSKVADSSITLSCAGRTDAGVHALGQVVHFDSPISRSFLAWQQGVNRYLSADIAVQWVREVPMDFHARFSAISRTYHYRIYNYPVKPVFNNEFATWIKRPLGAVVMHEAGQYLLGEQDFSSFRDSDCQSLTPMRNVQVINVRRNGNWIIVEITANAFLHHMVRNIIGTLLVIGYCKQPPTWIKEVLDARNRTSAAATAPAQGLFLTKVEYPKEFNIPLPIVDQLA